MSERRGENNVVDSTVPWVRTGCELWGGGRVSQVDNTGKAFHVVIKARKKIIRQAKPDKFKKKAVNPYSVMSFVSIK